MNSEELKTWFKKRPVWLQRAAKRIIEKGKLNEEDYNKFLECCLSEAKNELDAAGAVLPGEAPIEKLLNDQAFGSEIKLKGIRNVKGINALSPRNPLEFGEGNLSVIYGSNGSGKSGYARILKHVCGAKSCSPLLSNIFKEPETERKCEIEYQKDGEAKSAKWAVSEKPVDDLRRAHIFDSECGKVYVADENEVIYEPRILLFFSDLVKVCDGISSKIEEKIRREVSQKPSFPPEYKGTEEANWHENLSAETDEEEVKKHCQWTEEDEKKLSSLQTRLAQKDPAKEAEKIRGQNARVKKIIDESKKLSAVFSEEKYRAISALKEKHVQMAETAKAAADRVFGNSSLDGVGAETWRQLWEHAREYSEKEAYKGKLFPVISNDPLCVLCHQPLDSGAKKRLESFEEFVKGEAKKAEGAAKKSLEEAIERLPEISKEEDLEAKIAAEGLESEEGELKKLYAGLRKRKAQFQKILSDSPLSPSITPLPDIKKWEEKQASRIKDREEQAKQYDEDAREANREKTLAEQKKLSAKKWLSQQTDSVKKEIERLKRIKHFKKAKSLADTKSLSRKKSELSEKLITEDFIKRFNSELRDLKAGKIKVEIVKSRARKGKALHAIRLKGAVSGSVKTQEILSEGENRIVALSAFLADVTGEKTPAPFIFDDPISSLDQSFEEAVARRLVGLSKDRQVIVFTHRLSMLGLLEGYSKKHGIKLHAVCVEKEHWGAGEPGEMPLYAEKPKTALNFLIEKLPRARQILEDGGQRRYDEFAISLYNDFRITIERVIEEILLADIVKRHRRKIHAQNVKKLAKIKPEDCRILDDLMTKYSKPLHSQSDEAPCEIPELDELEGDFEKLKGWIKEFKKREPAS